MQNNYESTRVAPALPPKAVVAPEEEPKLRKVKSAATLSVAPSQRQGDVLSTWRASLTLSKAMLNAGVFSLPYAWKYGGLWASFVISVLVALINWYGDAKLVRCSQFLAVKTGKAALDYGHFAKKVVETSDIKSINKYGKTAMTVANITVLFYQLGLCSVAVLFIGDNLVNLVGDYLGGTRHYQMFMMCTITFLLTIITNLFTNMRMVASFAFWSSIFFIIGAGIIVQYCVRQESHWRELPAVSDFNGVLLMFGIMMYSFEGQTMVLPVENKTKNPEKFLSLPFGVLSITMVMSMTIMTAVGYYGYTAFGDGIEAAVTTNMPKTGFYTSVNVFIMVQSLLGNAMAMYVIFDMFEAGFMNMFKSKLPNVPEWIGDKSFRFFWVLATYLMAVLIPKLELLMPLVGVTSGTLCGFLYPPLLELITFWGEWKEVYSPWQRVSLVAADVFMVCLGILSIVLGVWSNVIAIADAFSKGDL